MSKALKSIFQVLMMLILLDGLVLFACLNVSAQAPGLIVVISSDTIWTKAGSPYNLTGPLLVNNGVTLTIESGVTVELNSYDIRVEGTLRILGSSSEKVYFNNGIARGQIEFRPNSTPWNEQTGSGCIIEHLIGITWIVSEVSLKIVDSAITFDVTVGDSSLVVNNEIGRHIFAGNSNNFSNNVVGGAVNVGSSNMFCNNSINGDFASGPLTLLFDNLISGETVVGESSEILNNIISGHIETSNSVISGNTLKFGLSGNSLKISNNRISGSGLLPAPPFGYYTISPIEVYGSSTISGNTIDGSDETPAIIISSGDSFLFGNIIFGAKIGVIAIGDATIEGNLFFDNGRGIELRQSDVVIRNNTFSRNDRGILSDELGGSAIIELNLFENNTMSGIDTHSQVLIQNNTFTNNYRAITIDELSSSDVTIIYNNFENNQNSIYLLRASSIFDVTNNWWGTIDSEAIGLGIHDSKYDFDLGTVTFAPFLTEPNLEAMPSGNPEIPEFQSWMFLSLFMVVCLVAVFCGKRFGNRLWRF